MVWRVLDTGINDAALNMAIDEAILLAHSAGDVPPTLRFYGWKPAAVSLGYFQKAKSEIDLEQCDALGIDVVRRLTGGRAVLHETELTYSIVVKEDDPLVPQTITASYRYFSNGLLAGLEKMGIRAQMSMPRGAYGKVREKDQHSSAACFDAPSHYEITYEGRKLVGSAQVRKHGVILQHGSILLQFSAEKLAAVLKVSSSQRRQLMIGMLSSGVTSIDQIRGCHTTWEETRDAVMAEFGPKIGVETQRGCLTQKEVETSNMLIESKYSQSQWNLLR